MNDNIKETVDQIIFYLNRIKNEKNEDYYIGNNEYLLNQVLRQIKLPITKYFVSEAAYLLWHQITDDDMMKYWYNDKVTVKLNMLSLIEFVGASNKGKAADKNIGETFTYRSVFHDDHIIPISFIMKKLMNLETPTREDVYEIIKEISVCRMLKSEDRTLPRTRGRVNESQVINEIYKDMKILPMPLYKELTLK